MASTTSGVKAAVTTAMAAVPSEVKKIVQNVKEIINCPEHEIYSMLQECNMDPDETVQRLLSQDTFHKVISKRERKKEVKETPELRPQANSSSSYCVPKSGGAESYISGSTEQTNSHESESSVYKRDLTYQTTSAKPMNQLNESYGSHSGTISPPQKGISVGAGDARHSSAQPSPGSQTLTSGAPGHASMAEIVRLGAVASNSLSRYVSHPQEVSLPPNSISNSDEMINEPGTHTITGGQHIYTEDWPVIRQPRAASLDNEIYSDHSTSHSSRSTLSVKGQPEFIFQTSEDNPQRNLRAEHNGSTQELGRQTIMECAWNSSHLDFEARKDVSSGQADPFTFMRQEGGGSKLPAPSYSAPFDRNIAKFQQLSLSKEDTKFPPEEDECYLVIPTHLQVSSADCSHLTFGTFNSGNGLGLSGSISSNPVESELKEATSAAIDWSSSSHISTGNLAHCYPHEIYADSEANDSTRRSHSELMKPCIRGSTQQQQYILPDYDFEKRQQLRLPSSHPQSNAHNTEVSSFSSRMGLKQNAFSTHQSNNGTGIATGLTYPQDYTLKQDALSVPQTYSQSSRPMEQHSASMNGYPIQPQAYSDLHSQASLPSRKQQPTIMNDYTVQPQSYADSQVQNALLNAARLKYMFPQYRSSTSVSSFPESTINSSGYGNFGVSSHTGNLSQKPSGTHAYEDILNAQYGDRNQYLYSQQNESSATSGYGLSARMQSPVPNNIYYGIQALKEPLAGYRQAQQSKPQQQLYEGQDFSNYLHQQSRIGQDELQKRVVDFTSDGTQSLSPTQSHQFWQPNF